MRSLLCNCIPETVLYFRIRNSNILCLVGVNFHSVHTILLVSPVHTSSEYECDANVDVTNSQQIIRSSSTLLNSLANIAAKGGLWRQIYVKFASQVWTGLKKDLDWLRAWKPFAQNTLVKYIISVESSPTVSLFCLLQLQQFPTHLVDLARSDTPTRILLRLLHWGTTQLWTLEVLSCLVSTCDILFWWWGPVTGFKKLVWLDLLGYLVSNKTLSTQLQQHLLFFVLLLGARFHAIWPDLFNLLISVTDYLWNNIYNSTYFCCPKCCAKVIFYSYVSINYKMNMQFRVIKWCQTVVTTVCYILW